ncbi:uncharacterized protein LOC112269353 [Brachypodium distachyon]|uniref:Uncharacterized protein n=1 Tax=Brachypodium distachyon TaxID=15368 RepID=A0A2K2CG87_BRADI|nr:uncharacterized protein LOC112269353 [Brachypodium distachyon]PNT61037.1 hypothetical protein BRADI_5g09402v3 [Brachypodium distachyon]|eukprot:XP_024311757.1 uncharacterized protein LOC112269353 [Brachypodium distachyon]
MMAAPYKRCSPVRRCWRFVRKHRAIEKGSRGGGGREGRQQRRRGARRAAAAKGHSGAGVDRVFVDHPLFLEKVWGKTGEKIYGPDTGTELKNNQLRFMINE